MCFCPIHFAVPFAGPRLPETGLPRSSWHWPLRRTCRRRVAGEPGPRALGHPGQIPRGRRPGGDPQNRGLQPRRAPVQICSCQGSVHQRASACWGQATCRTSSTPGGGGQGPKKICVPKIDLQFSAPLINFIPLPRPPPARAPLSRGLPGRHMHEGRVHEARGFYSVERAACPLGCLHCSGRRAPPSPGVRPLGLNGPNRRYPRRRCGSAE